MGLPSGPDPGLPYRPPTITPRDAKMRPWPAFHARSGTSDAARDEDTFSFDGPDDCEQKVADVNGNGNSGLLDAGLTVSGSGFCDQLRHQAPECTESVRSWLEDIERWQRSHLMALFQQHLNGKGSETHCSAVAAL
jgi:hypothetical protein